MELATDSDGRADSTAAQGVGRSGDDIFRFENINWKPLLVLPASCVRTVVERCALPGGQ